MANSNANKGKGLEDQIIKECEYYERKDIAVIKKIPNNWVVRRKGPHIVGANPIPSGLCDFIGTSKLVEGRTIVFDAKECKQKTRFPLRYIKPSQMDHMEETVKHGGIAFLVVFFTEIGGMYTIHYDQIKPFWDRAEESPEPGKMSIPLKYFQENAIELDQCDFMGSVEHYFTGKLQGI